MCARLKATRVLLVDTDPEVVRLIQNLLTGDPFKIAVESSCKAAMERAAVFLPDILIVSLSLPSNDGVELCRQIKQDDEHHAVFVIVLAGPKVGYAQAGELWKLGIDEFIEKPIDHDKFVTCVHDASHSVLSSRKLKQEFKDLYSSMDVLIVQDGGCAPGYNPVTAFVVEHMERYGRRCYAAAEGFRSVVSNQNRDYHRIIYDRAIYKREEHIPGVLSVSHLSNARGASFRSERYPEFKNQEETLKAIYGLQQRHVNVLVGIGGNGTFLGVQRLAEDLSSAVQTFFIPVTIDSDISHTECIGQHTGIEEGARKVASYWADAMTHKRIYIVEMMGARGGYHALHSSIGGRAHLVVLPGMELELTRVVDLLNKRSYAVIVVAEGYKVEERGNGMSASEFFYEELKQTGKPIKLRVICESFTRDIRGAHPNSQDMSLAQRMAFNAVQYMIEGRSRVMPAIQGTQEFPQPFDGITTDNAVHTNMVTVANRLLL